MKPSFRRSLALPAIALCSFTLLLAKPVLAEVKDACTVFSSADAEAALGEPVGPPRSEPNSSAAGDGSRCRYKSTIGRALSAKTISVSIQYSPTDLTGSNQGISDNLRSAGFKNVHDVSGVGTSAIWGTTSLLGKPEGELTVIKGKSVMLIVIISGIADEAAALDRAKSLAAKLLPKT